MATINSKEDICNLSTSLLGNYPSVNDIETGVDDLELTYKLWYDISRQTLLKMQMPNFALARRFVGQETNDNPLGYTNVYEYPVDCLRVLGIGDIDLKENNYTVEGGKIQTDELYDLGLPLRFVRDVTEVGLMSPEFKMLFAVYLAKNVCLAVTQDLTKIQLLEQKFPQEMNMVAAINAQENPPIRISKSRYRMARGGYLGQTIYAKK